MDQNELNFNKFQSFYNRFTDICGKTRQYLPIKNIHLPENIDFEGNYNFLCCTTNRTELKLTYLNFKKRWHPNCIKVVVSWNK